MRATGRLHLGHYHGVLKNWVRLQHEYECFFFVADWHGLTTEYEDPHGIQGHVWDLVTDWLAAGVNPGSATLFIQSQVPEHAELHLLLSMMTPLSWLERVPTYKDQQEKLREKDLGTYGFLGYPLLQAADILIYRAGQVPVGADQVAHVELTREVARRFNHLYGREPGFEEAVTAAIKKMGKKQARIYADNRRKYQEQGDESALEAARALVQNQQNITLGDKERLNGDLEGGGKVILPEPQSLLTPASKMPGLTVRKCPSPTATSSACARSRTTWTPRSAACPRIRRGCAAAIRARRRNARCGSSTRSIPTTAPASGCRKGAPPPASAAWSARSR